jgi:hypothetical protein
MRTILAGDHRQREAGGDPGVAGVVKGDRERAGADLLRRSGERAALDRDPGQGLWPLDLKPIGRRSARSLEPLEIGDLGDSVLQRGGVEPQCAATIQPAVRVELRERLGGLTAGE